MPMMQRVQFFYIKIRFKCEIESLELVNQCLLGSQRDRKTKESESTGR